RQVGRMHIADDPGFRQGVHPLIEALDQPVDRDHAPDPLEHRNGRVFRHCCIRHRVSHSSMLGERTTSAGAPGPCSLTYSNPATRDKPAPFSISTTAFSGKLRSASSSWATVMPVSPDES